MISYVGPYCSKSHKQAYRVVIYRYQRYLTISLLNIFVILWAYGVVVSMFDFHRSDRGSNPGRGGKIS